MAFTDVLAVADGLVRGILGEPVQYQPAFGPAVNLTGVFDPMYRRQDDSGLPGVANVGPAVWLRLASLPTSPATDTPTLTIRGEAYRVREVQPDWQGMALLHLLKV